jgi:uncharacterized protein YbjT (DUF2867 family)
MVYDVEEAIVGRRVTVFGANGRVGSLIVAELLTRGYDVVAVVHRGSRLPKNPHLRVIRADIYNSKSVDDAVVGSSAVVSALGSWGTHKKDILTVGMTHIIAGMQHHGIQRIVSLTGVEARALGDYLSFMHRLAHRMIRAVAGKILSDGEQHIVLLESSGLTWTDGSTLPHYVIASCSSGAV